MLGLPHRIFSHLYKLLAYGTLHRGYPWIKYISEELNYEVDPPPLPLSI